jgi:hypothetical protein
MNWLGLYRLRKELATRHVLKGHDFSRADKYPKLNPALAAEGRFSEIGSSMDALFQSLFSPAGFAPRNRRQNRLFPQAL